MSYALKTLVEVKRFYMLLLLADLFKYRIIKR